MKSLFRKLAAVGLLFSAAVTGVSAQVLYNANSWEATGGPPNWIIGPIVPQNGWVGLSADDGANNPITAETIIGTQTISPATGSQMQRIMGNAIEGRNSYVWVDLGNQYNTRNSGNDTVVVTSDIFLPGSESTSPRLSGIEEYDPAGDFIGGFLVSNADQAFILEGRGTLNNGNGVIIEGIVPRDEWVRVVTILDYNNNLIEAYINGLQVFFSLAFDNAFRTGWPLFPNAAAPLDFNDADLVSYGADGLVGDTSSLFTDNYRVEAVRSLTFEGTLSLEDVSIGDAQDPVLVLFELLDDQGNSRTGQVAVRLMEADSENAAQANYSVRFHDVPNGDYIVCIKGVRHLSRAVSVNVAGSGVVNLPAVSLLSGDANGDDSVDVFDLAELIDAFDAVEGDENFNRFSDFNYDDSIDVFDLAILIQNFDKIGECSE